MRKELFLHIACFFVGTDRDLTVKILEGCNFFAAIGIRVLADQCLIKYDCNKLMMHDMLRDMAEKSSGKNKLRNQGGGADCGIMRIPLKSAGRWNCEVHRHEI